MLSMCGSPHNNFVVQHVGQNVFKIPHLNEVLNYYEKGKFIQRRGYEFYLKYKR